MSSQRSSGVQASFLVRTWWVVEPRRMGCHWVGCLSPGYGFSGVSGGCFWASMLSHKGHKKVSACPMPFSWQMQLSRQMPLSWPSTFQRGNLLRPSYHLQQELCLWWADLWCLLWFLSLYSCQNHPCPRRQEPPSPRYTQYTTSFGFTTTERR